MNHIRNIFSVMVCCLGMSGNVAAEKVSLTELNDQSKQEALRLANLLAEKSKLLPQDVYQKLNTATFAGASFSEEQLEKLLKSVVNMGVPNTPETQELRAGIAQVQGLLAKKLQSYRVTGVSFAVDPNGAFFVDNQDPEFTVAYKGASGDIKTRRYKASIDSVGLKVEFAISFDMILFTNTSVNFYDSEKVIELGTGFEMSFWPLARINTAVFRVPEAERVVLDFNNPEHVAFDPNVPRWVQGVNQILHQFSITYVPFKNMPGGLFIQHFNFGISANVLSVVTGGTLTPLA